MKPTANTKKWREEGKEKGKSEFQIRKSPRFHAYPLLAHVSITFLTLTLLYDNIRMAKDRSFSPIARSEVLKETVVVVVNIL
jgi:hypothetical protein